MAAVQSAQSGLVPARVEYALGEAEVGINRREKMPDGHMEIGRNPAGARDKSLQVLSVFTAEDGKETRLVTLVNYACHGTVLGPDNNLVSADWIGVMRSKVEKELGGMAMFIQGAAANINPDMYWNDEHVYEKVSEQGEKVAESVVQTVKHGSSKLEITPIQMERSIAWLPTETKVETELPPKNYRKTIMDFAEMPSFMALFADLLLDTRYPWKPVIEARNGFWSIPMRVNAIRLGNLAWVSFAAETFTEIGMKVKAASPARHTIFSSITDGCISYLHTEASHPEGGYEVDVAPTAYRYPGRFQPQCESIVLEVTQTLLNKLWS